MPYSDASNSAVNGSLKFGIANVGVVVMEILRFWKVALASLFHPNWPFFKRLVSGHAKRP